MSIFTGDVGVKLELEFRDYEIVNGVPADVGPLNITGATEITFTFSKPDDWTETKLLSTTKVVISDGPNGKAHYLTEASFLDLSGSWQRSGKVELPGGTFSSEIVSFTVKKPL